MICDEPQVGVYKRRVSKRQSNLLANDLHYFRISFAAGWLEMTLA